MDLADASVALSIDASTYGLEALYAASYAFLDRAYVLLERPSPERYRVILAPKKRDAGELRDQLTRLAGELANELLASAYRQRLHTENRALIESVTMRAVAVPTPARVQLMMPSPKSSTRPRLANRLGGSVTRA